MAVIHIMSLDAVTVQAVKNKRYSEEKIVELNYRLQADTKKKSFPDRNDRFFRILICLWNIYP
ncbi:MAG: hypothetical protein K6A72_05505 [Lachnospiraceae bacterium]|nr:hypothetical protein [Lachnospiraceae bacterium]